MKQFYITEKGHYRILTRSLTGVHILKYEFFRKRNSEDQKYPLVIKKDRDYPSDSHSMNRVLFD